MSVSRKLHHNQFSATPRSRTMFVTRLGVSVLNVVATIDMPTSHHGAERPDVKNSEVLEPARRQKKSAGMNETAMLVAMMIQSIVANFTSYAAALGDAHFRQREGRAPRCRVVDVVVGGCSGAHGLDEAIRHDEVHSAEP